MARRAKAPFHVKPRNGWAWLDCRIAGRRHREALGVPLPVGASATQRRTAEEAGARKYAELVTGRVTAPHDRVRSALTLEEMIAMHLDVLENPVNRKSVATKRGYGRALVAWASDAERWAEDARTPLERLVADEGPERYMRVRLSQVLRDSVKKEVCYLFELLAWAELEHHIASQPPRPTIPKNEPGVRSGPQRSGPVHIEPSEARAVIEALPEWSTGRMPRGVPSKTPRDRFRVRAPFEIAWELAQRPATIARLSVPEHYVRGARHLTITEHADKARFARRIPLTARARAVLEAVAPEHGLIFGEHDYRDYLRAAALKALPPEKRAHFAAYDFRHGRALHLLEETSNLPGVSRILGHKQMTTTNAYLRSQERHAEAVIEAVDADSEEPAGAENVDTIPSHALDPDPFSPAISSGRVDSNHRPPDPQTGLVEESSTDPDEPPSAADVESREETADRGNPRTRFGHAEPLTAAARGLVIERAIWDAFDAFAFDAEESAP